MGVQRWVRGPRHVPGGPFLSGLGRPSWSGRLARGAGQQDDEDDELALELDDEPDVELSGIVFSPLKR